MDYIFGSATHDGVASETLLVDWLSKTLREALLILSEQAALLELHGIVECSCSGKDSVTARCCGILREGEEVLSLTEKGAAANP